MMIHSQTVVCEFIALCVLVLLPIASIVRADLASQSLHLQSSQSCGIHEESAITLFLLLYVLHSQFCAWNA